MSQHNERLPDCPEEVKFFSTPRPDSDEAEHVPVGHGPAPAYTTVEREGWQLIRITDHELIKLNRFRKDKRKPPRTQLYLDAVIIEPGPDEGKYSYVSYNMAEDGRPLGPESRYWKDWAMVNGGPPSERRVRMDARKFHRKELLGFVMNKRRVDDGVPYCIVTELRLIEDEDENGVEPRKTGRDPGEDDF